MLVRAVADAVDADETTLVGALRRLADDLPEEDAEIATLASLLAQLRVLADSDLSRPSNASCSRASRSPRRGVVGDREQRFDSPGLVGTVPPRDGPGPAPSIAFPQTLTRSWAYGDPDGRGRTGRRGRQRDRWRASAWSAGSSTTWRSIVTTRPTSGVRLRSRERTTICTATEPRARRSSDRWRPEVELVSVRVLRDDLKGSAAAFAYGVEWCIDEGIDIINLSMSTASERWAETFWDLVDRGDLPRSDARGGDEQRTQANDPERVRRRVLRRLRSGYRPRSDLVQSRGTRGMGCSGIDVDVAWLNGATIRTTGNSFAAPVVAGHLARIRLDTPGHQALAGEDRAGTTGGERGRSDRSG